MVPLSVLDLYPVTAETTPKAAIQASLRLAKRVDELGYHRYWVAEHHNMPSIASSAPEVLIGHVAGVTKNLRVGAGGIMLPNHSPLHVLEVFRTLEALHPGRIDLGIGRAPGTDPVTSAALRRVGSNPDEVNEQIGELIAFARKEFPTHHPFYKIDVMPTDVSVPPIWMLGSTSAGAAIAAHLGLPFAFAGHFSMAEAPRAIETYRSRFRGGAEGGSALEKSHFMMAVTVICGETDEHAEELAIPMRVVFARLASGVRAAFPTVEEAKRHRFTSDELAVVERFGRGALIGGPARVKEGLAKLVAETGADELMISTLMPSADDRIQSYERIAPAA